MGCSENIDSKVTFKNLRKNLYFIKKMPNAIPYYVIHLIIKRDGGFV